MSIQGSPAFGFRRAPAFRPALAVLCLAVLALAVATVFQPGAASASVRGEPIQFKFNYVNLTLGTTVAGDIDTMALKPANGKGALSIKGTWTNSKGDFSVPVKGFRFPGFTVKMDIVTVDGTVKLTAPARGHYNEATGSMEFEPTISLTLGTSDVATFPPPISNMGSGPLECQFSPVPLYLSTFGRWPHAAAPFRDRAAVADGSVVGAFTTLPPVKTVRGGALCSLFGAFLKPVGGFWMARSDQAINRIPAASGPKPAPGTAPVRCRDRAGSEGPICIEPAGFTRVRVRPGRLKIRQRQRRALTIRLTNGGDLAARRVKVCARPPGRLARKIKCVRVGRIPPKKTVRTRFLVRVKAKQGHGRIRIRITSRNAGYKTLRVPLKVR